MIVFKRLDDLSEAEIRRVIDINLIGTIIGSQMAIAALERAGGGSIINMSSADGISGANSLTAYCASKFAIIALTQALACEVGEDGVRVNAVAPTWVKTEFTKTMLDDPATTEKLLALMPLKAYADTKDVAAAVLYLAAPASKMVTGHTLPVDGGYLAR